MKERPLLFTGEMVRAIMSGRKTQTRRVLKTQPLDILPMPMDKNRWVALMRREPGGGIIFKCRYGEIGDRLWVRETWRIEKRNDSYYLDFKADPGSPNMQLLETGFGEIYANGKWRASIHMPMWASRITLEITNVRVERLQQISKYDAIQEGVRWSEAFPEGYTVGCELPGYGTRFGSAEGCYRALWNTLAKDHTAWDQNPWVWVIEFKKVEGES
jgi:hypothetical protein